MTFAGTAPQSTSIFTNSAKLSSAIICRVPPMLANLASIGVIASTPTQHVTARIKAGRANSGNYKSPAEIYGNEHEGS